MDVAAAEKDVRRSNPVKLNKTDKIMNVRIKVIEYNSVSYTQLTLPTNRDV